MKLDGVQRAALSRLTQALDYATKTGLLDQMAPAVSHPDTINRFCDDVAKMTPAPIQIIEDVCGDCDDDGISGIGAAAALRAMAPHWEDHLLEGSDPQIIYSDIEDLMQRLWGDARRDHASHCRRRGQASGRTDTGAIAGLRAQRTLLETK